MVETEASAKPFEKVIAGQSGLLVVAGIPAYDEEKTIAKVVLGAQKYANVEWSAMTAQPI